MTTAAGRPRAAGRESDPVGARAVVRSHAVDLTGGLLQRLPSAGNVLAWVRDGQGLVGWGERARLEVRGPGRFTAAQRWWRAQVQGFEVYDDVGVAGSGPVAFASFAFDDDSAESSVVIVPEVVLGRREGTTWLTTFGDPPRLAAPEPVTSPTGLRYAQGQASVTAFRAGVAEAVRRIRSGSVAKVVLAHDLVVSAEEPIDPRFLLGGLADRYPDCWTFAVDGLVGATPELLLSLHDGQVMSRVLAGTIARGGDAADDQRRHEQLMSSLKDQEEHRYALESFTAALAPHTSELTASQTPYLLELSNVAHLASDVSGQVDGPREVLELLADVHPSAAVGGTPTEVAVDLIRELEGMDRGRYAGPVGWLDAHGDGEWGIALRCAQLDGDAARLFAGCGIVAGSEPDDEVVEAQAKFVPVRDALEGAAD